MKIPFGGCGPLLPDDNTTAEPLRQQVLQMVRASGQTARADITGTLGISPGSATTITADLMAGGLLREVNAPPKDTKRGRPRVALEVVPDAAFAIGIKLSFKEHSAVLTDFAGHIVASTTLKTSKQRRSLDVMVTEIAHLIDKLLAKTTCERKKVQTIGIGLPGIVDHATGLVLWSSLLIERNQELKSACAVKTGIQVVVDNDANVLTLAELWFGAGRDMRDFAVVTIENGVGMGFVLNNRLFRGTHGLGLELGHTKVHLDGALCRCGKRGCLEAYLADYALAREAATALDLPFDSGAPPAAMLDTLFQSAKAGSVAAQTIFRRAGRYLAVGLSNVVQLFDPPLIILSGERMQYDYLYADSVIDEMQSLLLSQGGGKRCKVAVHAWDDLVWARGASALALAQITDVMFSKVSAA